MVVIDSQLFQKIRMLLVAGLNVEQIAEKYNLDPVELRQTLAELYTPKDEMEDSLRQTLLDLTKLIADERKKPKPDNDLILKALQLRVEIVEKLAKLREGFETWTPEKLAKVVGNLQSMNKIERVIECLAKMGFKNLPYEEIMKRLDKQSIDNIAKFVGCESATVYSGLYKIKEHGWSELKTKLSSLSTFFESENGKK